MVFIERCPVDVLTDPFKAYQRSFKSSKKRNNSDQNLSFVL